jgi:putative DNA primase/helicase
MAGLGLRVFPACGFDENMEPTCYAGANCEHGRRGKHAIERGWQRSATTDRTKIEAWWVKYPHANLGVATGNGILVLDIDPRNGGQDAFYDLQEQHSPLPDTLTVVTGGGGLHYYFRYSTELCITSNNNGTLGVGIDIKAEGGMVVGPGSQHLSGGRYDFEAGTDFDNIVIAEAPPWLLERLTAKSATPTAPKPERESGAKNHRHGFPAAVPRGQRHNFLRSEALFYRDIGLGRERTTLLLWANRERICEHDPKHPVTDKELHEIVSWTFEKAKPRPHRKPGPSRGELKILEWLKTHGCEGPRGFQWGSFTMDEIASGVSLTKRGTQKCLNWLEKRGLLTVQGLAGGRNSYLIVHQEQG